MSRSLKYDPALDGLRAVAVIAVVLFHTWPDKLPGGWAGVDLFFVLSGYLITQILVREWTSTGQIDFRRFYIRRALRLAPALAALVLAYLVFTAVTRDEMGDAPFDALMAITYLTNWSRALGWGDSEIGHTWSLAIEEQFYLVWPIILIALLRSSNSLRGAVVLLAAAVGWRVAMIVAGAGYERIYNGFDTHADPILIGCILALHPWKTARGGAALPLLLMVMWFLFVYVQEPLVLAFGYAIIGVLAAWLIASASGNGWFRTILSWRPLVFTGKISYGIYLWHFPIIVIGRHHVPESAWFVLPLIGYAAAVASYYVVERPFLRMKDRLAGPNPKLATSA
jgi:peptidoglycan/LPS O-acetylase OafA/YrhL